MNQKSSVRENPNSVSRMLMPDTITPALSTNPAEIPAQRIQGVHGRGLSVRISDHVQNQVVDLPRNRINLG